VDDFEAARTTPWEGVRNFEARNLMKEMSIGDKVRSLSHPNLIFHQARQKDIILSFEL
jgi:predicted RNA-binding protein with PUA-like domain